MTLTEMDRLLDLGEITPVDLVREAIENTEKYQEKVNAYITFLPEDAMEAAEKATLEIKKHGRRSRMHGIPYGVKDLVFTKGIRTTAGSRMMKDFIPDTDGDSVKNMKEAGAILMGKHNTQEWGCGPTGSKSYFGPVRNPYDNGRISGGSSSGSAAAVATGMVPCAVGTDAGGSIRIPSALCGVAGFMPSRGIVGGNGAFSGSITLGNTGPIAQTAEDCALMLDVMAMDKGVSYLDAVQSGGSLKGKKFAVPVNVFSDCVDDGVLKVFNECVEKLRSAGATVTETDMPWLLDVSSFSSSITFPEIAYLHKDRLKENPEGYDPAIKARIERGFSYPACEYIDALEKRKRARAQWTEFMRDYDQLILPTEPVTACPLYAETVNVNGTDHETAALLVKHTRIANVLGSPALSVNGGFADGLPVGIMFMGGINGDAKTLTLGAMFERI